MARPRSRNGRGRPPTIRDPRGSIRNAAAQLFARDGYEVTSLQDVAQMVGMTKAGLYHYFPTKQALFDAIVASTLDDLIQGAEQVLNGPGTARDRLVGYMVAHADFFAENRDRYRASFFGRAGGGMSDFTEQQLAARKTYVRHLETILRQGHAAGEFVVDDVPVLARGILGMLNWMARWYRPDGAMTARQIAESYAGIVISGIAAT